MCKLKSGLILKDRIFLPDYDSHDKMLEELGIKDDFLGASKKFVRVELSPVDNDPFSDIDTWVMNVDQDVRPAWFSEDEWKPKLVEAVKEWAKSHIHIGVNGLKITSDGEHYIKDCKNVEIKNSTVTAWENSTVIARDKAAVTAMENSTVTAWENSTVTAMENSTVTAWGNSTVTARENSTVTAWGNSTVTAWGNSTVTAWGNSTVTAWENSTVTAWGNSTVIATESSTVTARENSTILNDPCWTWYNRNTLILADNATFKDNKGKVIYQSGDYKLISVESGKSIGEVE